MGKTKKYLSQSAVTDAAPQKDAADAEPPRDAPAAVPSAQVSSADEHMRTQGGKPCQETERDAEGGAVGVKEEKPDGMAEGGASGTGEREKGADRAGGGEARRKWKRLLVLALSFLKIGLFTFGGGYAMIALIQKEFVTRKKWIGDEEFLDVVAIAESTPGPLAINSATYIGYKVWGVAGAVAATVSVCIPSFAIIYLISLFFDAFLQFTLVSYAFKGIQVCVVFLIFSAGLRMLRQMQKSLLGILLAGGTFICLVTLSLLAKDFSSIFYILICGAAGLCVYLVTAAVKRSKRAKPEAEQESAPCHEGGSESGETEQKDRKEGGQ